MVTASATDWSGCSSMSVSGWGATLRTAAINGSGAFSLTFTVPSNAPAGAEQLMFSPTCAHSAVAPFVTFTVTAGTVGPPGTSPPAAPSNLTATAVDQNDIRLNWQDNSNNETGFEINNGVVSRNAGAGSTTYTWGGLAPGTYMCFRIRAYNSAGDSAWDPNVSPYYVCTTTPKPPGASPPAAPSNLTVAPVDQHDIRLNWQDNSNNETGFEINNGVISKHAGANSVTYTWGGLAPGTYMCFRIRAYNSAGDSAWDPNVSPYYVCTTTPKPPTAPATHKMPYTDQYQGEPDENCDCGAADAAMVIVFYGKHAADPKGQWGSFLEEIRADSGNTGVCTKTDTSADLDFGELEAALSHAPWSLTYAEISKSLSGDDALAQIKAAVDAGKPVIALVHGTDLTTKPQGPLGPGQQPGRGYGYGDHFVLVKAVNGATVTFNDPDDQSHDSNVYPYWLPGGENTTLGVGQFEKALTDVPQGGQPYAISVGDGTAGG